jgi:hypothetical protein
MATRCTATVTPPAIGACTLQGVACTATRWPLLRGSRLPRARPLLLRAPRPRRAAVVALARPTTRPTRPPLSTLYRTLYTPDLHHLSAERVWRPSTTCPSLPLAGTQSIKWPSSSSARGMTAAVPTTTLVLILVILAIVIVAIIVTVVVIRRRNAKKKLQASM